MKSKTTNPTRSKPVSHKGTTGSDSNRAIRNPEELRQAIAEGHHEFRLLLMGGACFSRKHITMDERHCFRVFNYIDDSTQRLTGEQLYTQTNIGEAIETGAFVAEGNDHE